MDSAKDHTLVPGSESPLYYRQDLGNHEAPFLAHLPTPPVDVDAAGAAVVDGNVAPACDAETSESASERLCRRASRRVRASRPVLERLHLPRVPVDVGRLDCCAAPVSTVLCTTLTLLDAFPLPLLL